MKVLIIGENEANYDYICFKLNEHAVTFCDEPTTAIVAETPLTSFDLVFVISNGRCEFRQAVNVLSGHFKGLGLLEQYHEKVIFLETSPLHWPTRVKKPVADRATMQKR